MVRGAWYTLDDEVERKAFTLWGGKLDSKEDWERWIGLSTQSRGRWRNYARDGIKPTRTGQHKRTRITSGKGRYCFTSDNQPNNELKRGVLSKTNCDNCGQEIIVWSCRVQATKWCKGCMVEIKRLRGRKWHRENIPRVKDAKHPGRPIKPCVRLTEENIKKINS